MMVALVTVLMSVAYFVYIALSPPSTENETIAASTPSGESGPMTLDIYHKIKPGMKEAEVENTLGVSGIEMTDPSLDTGTDTTAEEYDNPTDDGKVVVHWAVALAKSSSIRCFGSRVCVTVC